MIMCSQALPHPGKNFKTNVQITYYTKKYAISKLRSITIH